MAEFKLGRIRFVWKNNWVTGTTYYKDDVVAYGGKTFLCVVGHTAAADFYTDLDNVPSKWNQFSDGQDWKGDWTGTTLYKVNDIVKYGGYVYICNEGHTSQSTLEQDQSKWDLFAESLDWKGDWGTATTYKVNDLVKYGGYIYIANTAHTSAATAALGLENDQSKWDLFSKGIDWKGAWTTSIRYKLGDLVKYGGVTYVCNQHHTSSASAASGLEVDQAKWDYFNQGIEYKGTWNSAVRYKVNDVVKNGGGTWICITPHTSASNFTTDVANWSQFVEGLEFDGVWATATTYQPGDIVRYGGNSYIAKTAHISSGVPNLDTTNYDLFSSGFDYQGDWNSGTTYKVGEVVNNNGFTYVATANNTNQKPPNASFWSLMNQGIEWRATWANATAYELGDAVKYGPNSYICIQGHTSNSATNRPDVDVLGNFWNLLTAGNEESALTTTGDLVYYSGSGPTRLPIGDEGQVLTVESGLPSWKYFGQVDKVFYVGPNGTDEPAPTYGLTVDKPFASVRYGLETILDGYQYQQAAYLLKMNRTFIQKEIVEWTDYQITNNNAPFTTGFTYDKAICQRDMGLLVDALVYDLTHGGNTRSIEAAEAYFTPLGVSYITGQEAETVASINYGVSLIASVLSNTAPAANYQALNGISVGDRIKQVIDSNYTAESGADTVCAGLAEIVTDAITAGDLDDLPVLDAPNYTLNVKTGLFEEVLPMIVHPNTAIVGDELRSTRISPAGKLIATNDKAKSLAALAHLRTITDEIIQNTPVTPTSGNIETQDTTSQKAGSIGSPTALASVIANTAEIKDIITNNTPDAYVTPNPTNWGTSLVNTAYASTGYPTGNTAGFDDARRLISANKAFLQDEVSEWILAQIAGNIAPFVGFTYGGTQQTKCERDVGLIVDALLYDLTYGGNLATQIAARSYYSLGAFVEPADEKAAALAVQLRIKDIIDNIATGNTAGWTKTTSLSQDVSGTPGSADAGAFAQDRIQEIYDTINTGTEPTTILPYTAWAAADLIRAKSLIDEIKEEIKSDGVQYIVREFPTLDFDRNLCSRDVGYIVDALGYDLLFGSNFLSIQNGLAYRRGLASTNLVITEQLAAQQAIVDFIGLKVSEIAASGAVTFADLLWSYILGIVNTGGIPVNTGVNYPTTDLDIINGANILRRNKDFFAAEATAYINTTYTTTVTASTGSTTDTFTCGDTSWMVAGDAIRFSGTVFGGVSTNTTYYVQSVVNPTTFKITDTLGGSAIDLSTASGSMTVSYYYNQSRCQNDVKRYIEAIARDMEYTGNYNVVLASRYYRNALTGSKLEDMFYVTNGCGIRNCTFLGLDGTSDGDQTGVNSPLTDPNVYGTRRPRAGAYVSLNPGWGPNDFRAWVTNKSTYVQNVTTFGTGCVGQKIDGSLHNGGVDSIVSNDFTQVLSDGIGAWVTNLGRAELVSVFTYYNHIGYLAENGGKIRATNGNNSYGDFGSVSEGIDITETEITGQINNRNSEADVRSTIVDGNNILVLEYGNAGSEYTSASYSISGAGINAAATGNEIRDEAVFQIRLTDPGDSSGTGGDSYITAANQAQSGNITQITLAAADTANSTAYIGMAIYLVAGTGAGQYGYITAYNSGSKVAQISKPSTGTAGWDHVVSGRPIASALDVTTGYEISPRIEISAPPFSKSLADLPSTSNWSDIVYGNGFGDYASVSVTGGFGTLATFDVLRVNSVYSVELNIPGVLYQVGDTLTIAGTSLGGASPANDVTITVTAVNSPSGSVSAFTFTGTPVTGKFVAIASGTTDAAYSLDGINWTAMTMPTATGSGTANQWKAITYGVYNNVGRYVAIARESSVSAFSIDGINWTATGLGDVADWNDVAYGNGVFVAIAQSDSSSSLRAISTDGGSNWSLSTIASGSIAITYGATRFVVVEGNFSNSVAYSTNGVAWTVATLPANDDSSESNWVDVTWGNGRYVAISDSSLMAAYSFDGATWYKSNLPAEAEWTSVRYGQGVFYATAKGEVAASSPDGVNWTLRDAIITPLDITATSEDTNPGIYTARTLPASVDWTDVIWTGTKFVAVGNNATGAFDTGYAASSTNGETWIAETITSAAGFEFKSIAYNGSNKYVVFINSSRNILGSADGVTWTAQSTNGVNNLPVARAWVDSAYGNGKFVAIGSGGVNSAVYSTDGTTWSQGTISSSTWTSVAQGLIGATHYFVAVSTTQNAAYSTDGITWTSGNTLPSSDVWSSVAYGNGRFVAVAGDPSTTTTKAAYSINGTTWTAATMPGAAARWVSVTYGGGAFTAFAYNSNRTSYSVDGVTWVEGPSLSSSTTWNTSAYGNDRNIVLSTSLSNAAASLNFVLDTNLLTTSSGTDNLKVGDKIVFQSDSAGAEIFGGVIPEVAYYVASIVNSTQFTISETYGGSNFVLSTGSGGMLGLVHREYVASALGNYQGVPRWAVIAANNSGVLNIRQGSRALARAYVLDDKLEEIWIHEPGSGYQGTTPTVTITDPNNIGPDATVQVRIGNGALGQPTWTNRGIGYTAATATILGDGYADNYQEGAFVGFKNLTDIPKAGSNVQIAGIDDVWYRLVNVTGLLPNDDGTYNATLQVSPAIGPAEAPEHETGTTIRRRYSQVRLTGHDFLDIGTGNFTNSNYPGLPLNDPIPANETRVGGGGRVFWTSTDQDGNFRVGGLFNVEQSTGVATLNADAFNIAGLNELSLGSVALGGSGATINEFSTDPFFTQDSDSVIPTQRAIKAYITSQIGGGGSSLNVNTLTAGVVFIAGQSITTTTNQQININTKVNFKGGIVGDALVLNYFLLNN